MIRNAAPGAANTRTPRRYPTMKAADASAAKRSRRDEVRSQTRIRKKTKTGSPTGPRIK